MKVILKDLKRSTIEAFANEHDLTMEIVERDPISWELGRYYAHFKGCEVKDDRFLASVSGNGSTMNEAITEYTKRISGKTLVFGAYTQNRVEIDCPYLDVAFIVI